jgi:thiamine-phosphate diphosphorylase/hydroxyethylthiazole kinase
MQCLVGQWQKRGWLTDWAATIDLATARKILGPDAIIGVTVSNIQELHQAATGGADYLGIGTVFATAT